MLVYQRVVFVSRWLLGLASHRGFIVVVSWTVTTSVDHAPLCLTAVSGPMPLSGLFEWPRKSTQRWQTFGTLFWFEAVPFPMLLNLNCLVLGVNQQAIWSLQWMCWPLACLFCKASFQACACLPWHPTHGNSMKFWGLGCHPMLNNNHLPGGTQLSAPQVLWALYHDGFTERRSTLVQQGPLSRPRL